MCRTLPVLLESVVLHVFYSSAECWLYYYHLFAALCERQCKITKKSENIVGVMALFYVDVV